MIARKNAALKHDQKGTSSHAPLKLVADLARKGRGFLYSALHDPTLNEVRCPHHSQ